MELWSERVRPSVSDCVSLMENVPIPNSEQYETLKCVKEDRFYTCYSLFAIFYVGYFHRLDTTVVTCNY